MTRTLEGVNSAAVEAVDRVLAREIVKIQGVLASDELDEIFSIGGNVPQTVQWGRAEDPDGTVRVRGLCDNQHENVEVTAWVRRI